MTCARYRELISRYVDDEVTPRQRADLLAHVQHCHECAAWLARLRQADVLLKGVPETRPSDRVRQAVIVTALDKKQRQPMPQDKRALAAHGHLHTTGLRLYASGLLLRFEMQPQRFALLFATALLSILGLAYWANTIRPMWGYDKFGFLYPSTAAQPAVATPTPLPAISLLTGAGGAVEAPNVLSVQPSAGSQQVSPKAAIRLLFDQPMDRSSVESAIRIDPPSSGLFSWSADNELSFTPSGVGLLGGITYTLSLSDTARSLSGEPVATPTSWTFRTAAPCSVTPDVPAGASLAPTSTIKLTFSTPMDAGITEKAISLRPAGLPSELPLAFSWSADGTQLSLVPAGPLPVGKALSLNISGSATTKDGQATGSPANFDYEVALPASRLRLLRGRLVITYSEAPVQVPFEALAGADSPLPEVAFDVYALPGSMLSALGAQTHDWPSALPDVGLKGLRHVTSLSASPGRDGSLPEVGKLTLPALSAGTYLVTATAQSPAGALSDWQLLIVADRSLSLTDGDVFWTTGQTGKIWPGAEVSLYSPEGALLDKGVTQEAGVWASQGLRGAGATLALARDLDGHVAALTLDGNQVSSQPATLDATLLTDRAFYYPGGRVQFRLMLDSQTVAQTPDLHVSVTLLNTAGQVVGLLTLRPDSSGGVTGLFDLSPDVVPGTYTLRATAIGAQRDFPITVNPDKNGTLGVYVLSTSESENNQVITGTVGVVGPHGEPEVGVLLTGTLHILGDTWVSSPVTTTTAADGRAGIATDLPGWSGRFNDPGLYLQVDASWQGNSGSASAPLDLTTVRHLQTGNADMVSPSMNIAAIAQRGNAGATSLRVVTLDDTPAGGDILAIAESTAGLRQAWAFNMESAKSKGDVTLAIPNTYAGGTVSISRAGIDGSRSIYLPGGSDAVSLSVMAPDTVAPGSAVPVVIGLKDSQGQGVAGDATLLWRSVSGLGESNGADALPWEPSVKIEASNPVTMTLTAPNSPGLWFVEVHSSTAPEGVQIVGRAAVKVMPAPIVMLPPTVSSAAGDASFSTTVYNPGPYGLSGNVQASSDGAIQFVSDSSQSIDVPTSGLQSLSWHASASQPGDHTITFVMRPSGSPESTCSMRLSARAASPENTTYAAGDMTGQQMVGVQVPSGMDSNVRLQVRASTSLLSALADAATSIKDRDGAKDINYWATLLSAAPSVDSAYKRANLDSPSALARSTAYRSLALQEIYALQHTDGGWSKDTDLDTPSDPAETAAVLLAIRRQSLAATEANEDLQPEVDSAVETRGLSFLAKSTAQSLGDLPTTAQLDERARSFYALSLYGAAHPEEVRPLIAYLPGGADSGLSQAGEAWLALALWQGGDTADSLAVLDRLMDERPGTVESAGPALEALAVMNMANRNNAKLNDGLSGPGNGTSSRGSDLDLEREYVQLLMQARQGAGWQTPGEADAIWALSRYAAEDAGSPAGRPDVMLNDGALGVASEPGNPDTFVVEVSGGPLHAGTNWLKLQGMESQSIYYSLTLKAER